MKNFFLFWVDFPELLSCLCFTKRRLPFVFAPKNPHHRLPEILRWYACGADGRSGGRSVYCHVITKFSQVGCLPHFVTHGAPLHASHGRAPLLFSNIFAIFIVICFVTYWHIYLVIDSFTFCCVLMLLICCQDKNKKWKNIRARCLLCSFSSKQTSFYHILYLFDSCLFNASTAICFSISFLYLFALSPLPRTFQFLPLVFAAFV